MKITEEYLKRIKACPQGITKFKNTKELYNLDLDNVNEIIVGDENLFVDLNWLIDKLKGKLKINKLTYKNSDEYWREYTYDKNNNVLTYKDSKGYWKKVTYDENGNLLTYETSNKYWEKYTYDENGNLLTYRNSKGYWEEDTYDENGNLLTYRNSKEEFVDCSKIKYNLTGFEIKYTL